MKKPPRIVVIGSLVFDFVARAPRLPRTGETLLGDMFGMFPGGKGANQAVQAARLGAEVYMVGRVGDDLLGERLLSSLHESGVHTEFVKRDPSAQTAACCIHVDSQGNNAIIIVPEANMACSPEDVDAVEEVIQSANAVICQLEIPLPTVAHAVNLAAKHGVLVILNPAPAQQIHESLLSKVTVLTPNEIEAEFLSGIAPSMKPPAGLAHDSWESRVARKLLAAGPQSVIVTLGERGAYLASEQIERLVPTFRVPVVDATAAGDAFNGALAVALAEGQAIEDAVTFANAAGALATTRVGAQPSLASRAEVETLLRETK